MTENFADAPMSITEIRADKEQNGALWTPRDALIYLLRQIDKGELKIDQIVCAYIADDKPHYVCSVKTIHDRIAILEIIKSGMLFDYFSNR